MQRTLSATMRVEYMNPIGCSPISFLQQ